MKRTLAALAVAGALTLSGCGGGGGGSISPLPSNQTATNPTSPTLPSKVAGAPAGYLTVSVPYTTSGTIAQSTQRAILSSARKPAYINTTTSNSALVVSVTPQDPSEAAQYGNLTVCYNLYTGGTLAAAAPPNFTYTTQAAPPNTNIAVTVTLAIPAPPGSDSFQITQYAGQCGGTPYTAPTAPPGTVGSSNILAQTPATLAYMNPGLANNLNNQIAACTPVPASGSCNPGVGGGPAATLVAGVTIASIAFGGSGNLTTGALPIGSPVREQSSFSSAGTKFIGIPIPLEALDASGAVIPGLNTPANPAGNLGAGPFPSGVTVTWSDSSAHTAMYLVDATNGGIAQKAASNTAGLLIHAFNELSDNTLQGASGNCNGNNTTCNDITFGGSTAVVGHPWVIVLTFDGTDASIVSSITVTAKATIPPATTASTITATITPQSAVWSVGAVGAGYTDTSAPVAPLNMLQQGANVFFTDATTVKTDGGGPVSSAIGGSKLAGLAYATWPNPTTQTTKFIYATDANQASGTSAAEVASGVYSWVAPGLTGPLPVAAQAGAANYLKFNKPVGACEAAGSDGAYYLYVEDASGNLYQLDIGNLGATDGFGQLATNTQQVLTGGATTLNPTGSSFVGTAPVGGTGATGCLFADPGNNRIAMVNTTTSPVTVTSYASGFPFTGIYLSGTAVYATSTSGQIYYISGSGATPASFGLTTGATADGPVGPISSLTPASNLTLTAVPYGLQGAAGSFFALSPFVAVTGAAYTSLSYPYTLAAFPGGATPQAFAGAPNAGVGLTNDTTTAAVQGKVKATGGLVVFPAGTAATATVTPDSILFVDGGTNLRTLVR